MMQYTTHPQNDIHYRHFIDQLIRQNTVFTLQDSDDFYAECPSESYDNELDEPETVYCFWHTATAAQACQQEEWADYAVTEIGLADFMYETLIEMDSQHHLVGVSFDADLVGIEIEPIELLADLLDEIQQRGLADEYPEFDELQRYRLQWEKMVWQQEMVH